MNAAVRACLSGLRPRSSTNIFPSHRKWQASFRGLWSTERVSEVRFANQHIQGLTKNSISFDPMFFRHLQGEERMRGVMPRAACTTLNICLTHSAPNFSPSFVPRASASLSKLSGCAKRERMSNHTLSTRPSPKLHHDRRTLIYDAVDVQIRASGKIKQRQQLTYASQ